MSQLSFSLDSLPVAITGAAGLLGRNYAFAVAEAGGLPIAIDVDGRGLNSLSNSLAAAGANFLSFQLDSTDEKAVKKVAKQVRDQVGPIYGIVNNVAANPKMDSPGDGIGRVDRTPLSQWREEHDVSLASIFLMTKYFGPHLVERGEGSIVNIASDLAIISPDQRVYELKNHPPDLQSKKPMSYSSTKAAVLGITRYLATYWAPLPIRSNALLPGSVLSDQSAALRRALEVRIPLGRLASPNEYNGALVFLLSPASSYVNGASLVMDGGRSVW